jgi:hypothetical protein
MKKRFPEKYTTDPDLVPDPVDSDMDDYDDDPTWIGMNAIVRENSAFTDFNDLVNAKGGYRPSIEVNTIDKIRMADNYDEYMERVGDDRRAYRFGGNK